MVTMAVLDGCGSLTPIGIQSPDRPAGSESLNRLSYPGLYKLTISIYCDSHTTLCEELRFYNTWYI